MKNAREYAEIFKTGQYGRFFVQNDSNYSGTNFCIWLLPGKVSCSHFLDASKHPESIEIYGITNKHSAIRDSYGWLYNGKWQEDFEELANETQQEQIKNYKAAESEALQNRGKEMERIKKVLSNYPNT